MKIMYNGTEFIGTQKEIRTQLRTHLKSFPLVCKDAKTFSLAGYQYQPLSADTIKDVIIEKIINEQLA